MVTPKAKGVQSMTMGTSSSCKSRLLSDLQLLLRRRLYERDRDSRAATLADQILRLAAPSRGELFFNCPFFFPNLSTLSATSQICNFFMPGQNPTFQVGTHQASTASFFHHNFSATHDDHFFIAQDHIHLITSCLQAHGHTYTIHVISLQIATHKTKE
jgi:hypothetical protein